MREEEITFVIPTFGIEPSRMANLEFVLRKISEVSSNVLVVEQVARKNEKTIASEICEQMGVARHAVTIRSKNIHKPKLINAGVRRAKTPFVWVNDADCYMKFAEVVPFIKRPADFIQPYRIAKKLTSSQTESLLAGKKVKVGFAKADRASFVDGRKMPGHISMMSALSFIVKKRAFMEIGGMDEQYKGWGFEDTDFCYRVLSDKRFLFRIEHYKAVHLHHNNDSDARRKMYGRNRELFSAKFGAPYRDLVEEIKNAYISKTHTLAVIGIGRTGTACLAGAMARSIGDTFCGEPFGSWGINGNALNPYRPNLNKSVEAYVGSVLSGERLIKHLVSEVVAAEGVVRSAMATGTRLLMQSREVAVFTTRHNFLDWLVSWTVAFSEKNFLGSVYSGKQWPISRAAFDTAYAVWSEWHNETLPRLIEMRKAAGKTFHVLDYEQIADPEFLRDFVLKNIPGATAERFRIPTKKQKTGENRDYISNYDDVLLWYDQTRKQ